jgi:hypothetical protein
MFIFQRDIDNELCEADLLSEFVMPDSIRHPEAIAQGLGMQKTAASKPPLLCVRS